MGVNMNNRKILNFITPNVNDKFSWMELNCTYRPVANILKCYEKEYYSYYLMISSFLDIYFYKDNGGKERHYITEHYYDNLRLLFGIDINKKSISSKYDFIFSIKESIDLSRPVLISVDLKELPYYEMYKVQHHDKNFTVYGYDMEKELFYILDNLHTKIVDDTLLSPFVISFEELYSMAKSYNNHFAKEQNPFYYEFERKAEDACAMSDAMRVFNAVISLNDSSYIYPEEDTLIKIQEGNECSDLDIEKMCMKHNYRNVLYKFVNEFLMEKGYDITELQKLEDKIVRSWEDIRDIVLMSSCINNKDLMDSTCGKIAGVKQDEREFRRILSNFITNTEWEHERKNKTYSIINNLGCEILEKGNAIKIKLTPDYIYDLWNINNDGPQIYPVKNFFQIQAKVIADINNSDKYHAGLIILDNAGNKYMFGIFENNKIMFCCPSYGDNYEIKSVEYLSNDFSVKLKLNILNKNHIKLFYCKDDKEVDFRDK